jgi:heme oxygenase (biliverdin-IX-beta and delta-forming)
MNSLLSEVRAFTDRCHEEIEAKIDIFSRVRTIEDYQTLLLRLLAFYTPIEQALDKYSLELGTLGIWQDRRKTTLLTQDLEYFKIPSSLIQECPHSNLPTLFNLSQAIGCLYVLEGSTLGGQYIYKHFRNLFNMTEAQGGLAYYKGYGQSTRKMWTAFCNSLNRYSERLKDPSDRLVVLASAKQTFERFGTWLCNP